ncbi:MAG TPA: hypothetical protein VFG20_07825 [Planctomycetaceae bacterium]|nr:hypothetical protein [Planctomycetaceae bacterium]
MKRWLMLCGLLAASMIGCQKTPQQQLVGRWSNGDMSVRFREDGRVLIFSRSGRAEGRYVFYGPNAASRAATENLIMDVQRNGKIARMFLDADFLGTDRLRLSDLTPKPNRAAEPTPEFAVLRRSVDAPVTAASR